MRRQSKASPVSPRQPGRQGPWLDTTAVPTLAGPSGAGRGIPRPGAAPGPLPERRGCWKAIDSFWQRQRGKYFDHVTPHKRSSSLRVCNLHKRCHRPGTPPPPRLSRLGNASIRHRRGKTAGGTHTPGTAHGHRGPGTERAPPARNSTFLPTGRDNFQI